ncbi:MAG: type II toxin-antitoxin system VapC family toxin [Sphingobacteriaceae bacterium]|nr:MAG: type II toxin-antitoxin system VapC family toxin [Sphingobacteriaceae bacterium]
MVTLVDSCVLIDASSGSDGWKEISEQYIGQCAAEGVLAINCIVYAEVSVNFPSIENLDEFLPKNRYRREDIPLEAAFMAGKKIKDYKLQRKGKRNNPWPDLYIAAHAYTKSFRLLTKDKDMVKIFSDANVLLMEK